MQILDGNNDIEYAEDLLNSIKPTDINYVDSNWGDTALHLASRSNCSEIAQKLLSRRLINVNARNNFGETPLLLASALGHSSIVAVLLKRQGTNVNTPRIVDSRTALILATFRGHTEVVELLLGHNRIDLNAQDGNGDTALILASNQGSTKIVELLLKQAPIDLNLRNTAGNTALALASWKGHMEVTKLLLDDSRVDRDLTEPIHDTPIVSGQAYSLVNMASGTCLDLNAHDELTVQGHDYNGGSNQKWIAIVADGGWKFKSGYSNRYLSVKSLSYATISGAPCQVSDSSVVWTVEAVQPGIYTLKLPLSINIHGLALDMAGSSRRNGAPVLAFGYHGEPNQTWKFVRASLDNGQNATKDDTLIPIDVAKDGNPIISGQAYILVNMSTGTYLDLHGHNLLQVIGHEDNGGGSNQKWIATAAGSGWTFKNARSGTYLSAQDLNYFTASKTPSEVYKTPVVWKAGSVQPGIYTLRLPLSTNINDLALDLPESNISCGVTVIVNKFHGGPNQSWKFVPVGL